MEEKPADQPDLEKPHKAPDLEPWSDGFYELTNAHDYPDTNLDNDLLTDFG